MIRGHALRGRTYVSQNEKESRARNHGIVWHLYCVRAARTNEGTFFPAITLFAKPKEEPGDPTLAVLNRGHLTAQRS